MPQERWLEIDKATYITAGMDREKILRYIKQGYIQSYGTTFNLTETNFIVEYERYLSSNYMRLSTLFKKHIKTTYHNFNSFMEAYKYLFNFIEFNKIMYIINHDNKQYIKNEAVQEILRLIISKPDVVEITKSNDILFDNFIEEHDIKTLNFSSTSQYITKESYEVYKNHMRDNKLMSTIKWEKLYTIFMSGEYSLLSVYLQGLKIICIKFGVKMITHKSKNYVDIDGLNIVNRFMKENDQYIILKNNNFFIDSIDEYNSLSLLDKNKLIQELKDFYIRYIEFNKEGFNKVLIINKSDYKRFIKKRNIFFSKVRRIAKSKEESQLDYKSEVVRYIHKSIYSDSKSSYNATCIGQEPGIKESKRSKLQVKKRKIKIIKKAKLLDSQFFTINERGISYSHMISRKRCEDILGLKPSKLFKLSSTQVVPNIKMGRASLYNIKTIRALNQRNEYLRKNYVHISNIKDSFLRESLKNHKDLYHPIGYELYAFGRYRNRLIPKHIFEMENSKLEMKNRLEIIDYTNPFQAYVEYVKINKLNEGLPEETLEYWNKFIRLKLVKTQASKQNIKNKISLFIDCLKILEMICKEEDIFKKSSKEINFNMNSFNVSSTKRGYISSFLKFVHDNRFYKKQYLNYRLYKLDFAKSRGNSRLSRNTNDDIYTDEVFLNLLSFIKKDFHKELAILDSLNKINKNSVIKTVDYCYSWFYISLHLNNAWRHIDFIDMNMIDISFLNIKSLEEFSETTLSKSQIDMIISKLVIRKYVVSKTGAQNNLFISEELKESVANAYLICHLLNEKIYPVSNKIIHFSNKSNRFNTKQHGIFKNFKHELVFRNRKMNKTLLTTMAKMISKYDDSSQVYYVSKALRGHKNYKSSNFYVKYTDQEINEISKKLFDSGVFGFIPSLLEKVVNENSTELNSVEQQSIESIRNIKNIFNIEVSAAFINSINDEKQSIIDYIISKGIENAYTTLNKLSLNLLSGKEENYQCLRAELGCNRPALDCKNCLMSIPNRFTISNLIKSIDERIRDITYNFNDYTEFEKVRIANAMFTELNLFHDAISKFGKESVFNMLEEGKASYISILDTLDYLNNNNNLIDYISKKNLLESD